MVNHSSVGYLTPFVGRTQELTDVTARLLDPECRLLTVTGLGGSGKTRLALEAASLVAPHFPHHSVLVSLQPLTRSDLLVPTIAQALGVTFYGDTEPYEQVLAYLHDKTLLLILDNFEHVLDEATLVEHILAAAPGVTLLVTSREALSLQQEWLYPLKGMAIPHSVYATSLENYEAVQLFLYHARRIQPQFDLAAEHEAVVRICLMTAGLPLALELATSWLKGLRATHIANQMQRNLDFLSTTTRNMEPRHRSMRAVFDQSWALLADHERLMFARLSVFLGGFDVEAAGHVAEASFASLAALVEKSLIHLEPAERFGMHELLRQYGMERLDAYGETEATYTRHSQYYARLLLQYETGLKQPQQLEIMHLVERDFDNIRLAWEWSATHGQWSHLHTMLNGLYLFGFLRSRYRETITIFQQTLDQGVADSPLRGRLLARRWGYLHWWYQEEYGEALGRIHEALALAQAENDQFEIAFCQLMVSYVMAGMERYADAFPHLELSHSLFDALDEPYYVCWVLHRLGYMCYNLDETDQGNAYTEQSLALARVTRNRIALVICLYNLGSVYILKSDYIKGQRYCAEALQFATETGHQGQVAHTLSLLALCAFCQGDYTTCRTYADQAQAITEELNQFLFHAYNYSLLTLLACLREDYAAGARLGELGSRHTTNMMGFQLLYWARASLACGLGSPTEARLYIQKLLHLGDSAVNPGPAIWIVPSVAYVLADSEPEQAVELLAWVHTYPDTALDWARRWPLLDRLQGQLQDVLDRDTYQMGWKRGKALTLATITSYLQQAFPTPSAASADPGRQHILTAREREILSLMAAGMTNPQIAAQLVIGVGTVKTHTLTIYRKLEVANRTQAIVRAQELGLLSA